MVVKGVDIDGDPVVGQDLFAFRHIGADQARIVLGDKGDVEVLVVIGEKCGGRLAHRVAVARVHLPEVGDRQFGLARRYRSGNRRVWVASKHEES